MRSVLIALVALALLGLNAWASVPDPDYCTVTGDGALYPADVAGAVYPAPVGLPEGPQ